MRDAELTLPIPEVARELIGDVPVGRWAGLGLLGVASALISGVAEALGKSVRLRRPTRPVILASLSPLSAFRTDADDLSGMVDLGALDDNLTLPIISGGCLLGVFKVLQWCSPSAP